MRMVELITKKRDGEELNEAEIRFIIEGFTAGTIPDYQMSAFAMAVIFRGMTKAETVVLTDAMMRSGDSVDLSRFGKLSVDKHSTGGVGDKTTLIVAPVVASLGAKIAKMSGRGLGHTGGTVDKLESIPGFHTTLTPEEFANQVEKIGVAVIGQSGNLTPADKKLYALRDVTGTVDSLPLIASSIMSKKLAAGAHSIVLDVKVGSGAFMTTLPDAKLLAQTMVELGKACGRQMAAVLTDMDNPLGFCIGNTLEVEEACEVLKGRGPADLREVCLTLCANMLSLVFGWPVTEAYEKAAEAIENGSAFATMKKWVAAQGGDAEALEDYSRMKQPTAKKTITSDREGIITGIQAKAIGEAAVILGAGRATKDDSIDASAGIRLLVKPGERITAGQSIAVMYSDHPEMFAQAENRILHAFGVGSSYEERPLVYEVIS